MLKVSRTAFYTRLTDTPGPRAVRDAELTQQITQVHEQSRGTYGSPRVHAVLKRELLGTAAWTSRATARVAIFGYIEGWYNLHRLHSNLGYRGPADHETALAA
ncbi:IS3 family transposase [Streptomyces hirsutus]|uniref:IS3 family transposase n=1 Tax=Streptomyces hirsutus TaxID=35620 RepID=UPI003636468B